MADLEDVRAGGGDGGAGADVEDLRDLVHGGLIDGLRGGGDRTQPEQTEPEQ